MTEPTTRVCPRCGEPAAASDRCPTCGANLAAMREMLPTRADWETANPAPAGPDPDGPGAGLRSRWGAISSARKQTIVSLAVVALFVVVLIAGTGSSSKPPNDLPAGGTTSSPTAASTGTTSTTPATTTAAAGTPTVTSCAAAWNGGKSARHRRLLLGTVAHAAQAGAVIATYAGAARQVAREGGGNPVQVNAHACVVAADDLVFIQQPDGSWGFSKATPTRFAGISGDSSWTVHHANATVQLGSTAAAGFVIPRGGSLVVLRTSDV